MLKQLVARQAAAKPQQRAVLVESRRVIHGLKRAGSQNISLTSVLQPSKAKLDALNLLPLGEQGKHTSPRFEVGFAIFRASIVSLWSVWEGHGHSRDFFQGTHFLFVQYGSWQFRPWLMVVCLQCGQDMGLAQPRFRTFTYDTWRQGWFPLPLPQFVMKAFHWNPRRQLPQEELLNALLDSQRE